MHRLKGAPLESPIARDLEVLDFWLEVLDFWPVLSRLPFWVVARLDLLLVPIAILPTSAVLPCVRRTSFRPKVSCLIGLPGEGSINDLPM